MRVYTAPLNSAVMPPCPPDVWGHLRDALIVRMPHRAIDELDTVHLASHEVAQRFVLYGLVFDFKPGP